MDTPAHHAGFEVMQGESYSWVPLSKAGMLQAENTPILQPKSRTSYLSKCE